MLAVASIRTMKKISGKRIRFDSRRSSLKPFLLIVGVFVYTVLQIIYYKSSPPPPPTTKIDKNSETDTTSDTSESAMKPYLMLNNDTAPFTLPKLPPRPPPPNSSERKPKFAYAFLIAGVNPDKPVTYRNYLIHVLIATYTLRRHSTKADVVLMIQLSAYTNETNSVLFPELELDEAPIEANSNTNPGSTSTTKPMTTKQTFQTLIRELNIKLFYTSKPLRDNFYTAQMAKFEILKLDAYDRILYMDADVLPLCNLDYIFDATMSVSSVREEASSPASQPPRLQLKPNVILSWFNEPAHGGFFLLQPSMEYYHAIQSIITRRELQALYLLSPPKHWDPIIGWGMHPIQIDDAWHGLPSWKPPPSSSQYPSLYHATSTNWTFHGDFADQGLLYYYTKYYLRNVSIMFLDHIEQWGDGPDPKGKTNDGSKETASGGVVTRATHLEAIHYILPSSTSKGASQVTQQDPTRSYYSFRGCLPPKMEYPGRYGSSMHPLLYDHVPHRDFVHFSGSSKPWEQSNPPAVSIKDVRVDQISSSADYWWHQFYQLKETYRNHTSNSRDGTSRTINLSSLRVDRNARPNLGRYPTYRSMIGTIQKKLKKQQLRQQQQRLQQQ